MFARALGARSPRPRRWRGTHLPRGLDGPTPNPLLRRALLAGLGLSAEQGSGCRASVAHGGGPCTGGYPLRRRRATCPVQRHQGPAAGRDASPSGSSATPATACSSPAPSSPAPRALAGNDLATFPDFPAEIRAPAGSLAGVSGYQVNFGAKDVHTPGDQPDVLVAMNPAALKTNLRRPAPRRACSSSTPAPSPPANLEKAGYAEPARRRGAQADLQGRPGRHEQADRGGARGLGPLLEGRRPLQQLLRARAHVLALQPAARAAGRGHPAEVRARSRSSPTPTSRSSRPATPSARPRSSASSGTWCRPREAAPGIYRNVTGNHADRPRLRRRGQAHRPAGLPRQLPHHARHRDPPGAAPTSRSTGVVTFQAEDEIAGIGSAIGASFGGSLAAAPPPPARAWRSSPR